MAGNVADGDDGFSVGEVEPVVEVAGDVGSGVVEGGDVERGEGDAGGGEPGELDLAGLGELSGEEVVAEALGADAGADELDGGGEEDGGHRADDEDGPEEGAAEGSVDDGVDVAERCNDHQHPLFPGDADGFDGDEAGGKGLAAEDVVVVDALVALVGFGGVL